MSRISLPSKAYGALPRTISVDIRFVLFITDKFSGAAHLLKEIGI